MLINHGGHRVLDKLTKENVGKIFKNPPLSKQPVISWKMLTPKHKVLFK
jgi:hypothetical protein